MSKISPILVSIAQQLMEKLDGLHGELDTAVNPHRVALRHLGVTDTLGGVREPYHDEAFKVWTEVLRKNSGDLESLHHLAIMHHARAIDLEANRDAARSDTDWEAALRCWHRLWQTEQFWDRLVQATGATNCKAAAGIVKDLRARLPILLLNVHYDIAFNLTPDRIHRSRRHIGLAQQSPFPPDAKEAARRECYAAFVRSLPVTVWQNDVRDPAAIKVGTDRIEKYLELDPGCLPALEDALRLQMRLLRAWYTELQAAGDDDSSKRKGLLDSLRKAGDYWRPYFDQIVAAGSQDEAIRQKLVLWYRVMGDILCSLDQEEKAIAFYEQGLKAWRTNDDEEERQRCQTALGRAYAYVARELAHKKSPNARAYCDRVRSRKDLSPTAHFLLANAYKLMEEFNIAEQVCLDGLKVQSNSMDVDAMTAQERDRQHLQEMLEDIGKQRHYAASKKLVDQAMHHLNGDRPEQALPLLNQAITQSPDAAPIYLYRGKCHLDLNRLDAAAADLNQYKSLAEEPNQEYAQRLEKEIKERRALVAQFGNNGLELRRQGAEAFNRNDFSRAEDCLRRALAECPRAGRAILNKELSTVLKAQAVAEVNGAMENDALSDDQKLSSCQSAQRRLQEAGRLDPDAQDIQTNLQNLANLIPQIQAAAANRQQAEALRQQYGTAEALELQQKAVQAFNANRHDEAIRLLRQALSASGNRQKLREELSIVLTMVAVAKVNKANSSERESALGDAREMLTEAMSLDPHNQRAMQNLSILMGLNQ